MLHLQARPSLSFPKGLKDRIQSGKRSSRG